MSTTELRKKLIDRINRTEDRDLLEEVVRLLDINVDEVNTYVLSEDQKSAVSEAREQIKIGKSLTDEEADRDIDEWLEK